MPLPTKIQLYLSGSSFFMSRFALANISCPSATLHLYENRLWSNYGYGKNVVFQAEGDGLSATKNKGESNYEQQ
jgi:hypothetical protein